MRVASLEIVPLKADLQNNQHKHIVQDQNNEHIQTVTETAQLQGDYQSKTAELESKYRSFSIASRDSHSPQPRSSTWARQHACPHESEKTSPRPA